MHLERFIAPLLLLALVSTVWAEAQVVDVSDEEAVVETPAKKKSALSGMTIPIAPKLPPELCGVQPMSLREFPIVFIGAYDGDTIAAKIDLGFGLGFQKKVRLLGVNAPEDWCSRGTSKADCESQQAAAQAATEFVVGFMKESEKGLFLKYWRKGKFGHPLGVICRHDDGKCINYELLTKKLADYYCGKKR